MAADEAGTLAALKRHREVIFDPAVIAHNGRNVKLIGDGVIAEFGSVVDAVKCALSVQRSGASRQGQKAEQPTIVVRIGINLGDVMIEGDDIFGDGVNIAARLEPLAEPGGICVSSIANGSVGNRIDARFQDSGNISVRISTDRYESGNGNRARRSRPSPVPTRLNHGRTAHLRRSLSCRSPTCRATQNRSTSQTGSAKTLSPTCQRLPA
jgi:Adenylate and Guanylate cyclase catalytic domain